MMMNTDPGKFPAGYDNDQTYDSTQSVNSSRKSLVSIPDANYMQPAKLGTNQAPGANAPTFSAPGAVQVQTPGMNGSPVAGVAIGGQVANWTQAQPQYGARGFPAGYNQA